MNKNREKNLVIKYKHISSYPNPIKLNKGQSVIVGEKYTGNEEWNNWVYCLTADKSSEGWVPEQIIEGTRDNGTILEDYSAKELNMKQGDRVIKLKELNGWYWVRDLTDYEEGWIPKRITE
ncbi:SH3 domain-containing protein [Rossellomorea sp. NPDC077527]|uniref:SH3 domain-containing protein n=1 Tax=Rossellomorea sp. NPDC077527 TaxID=3364510 RepID=UPI0037CA2534